MKLYYYSNNEQQFGPFTIEELKTKRLTMSTLIWTEGMQDWKTAREIDELKNNILSNPPPLPTKGSTHKKHATTQNYQYIASDYTRKFDLTYKKEKEATFLGILILLVSVFAKLTGGPIFVFEDNIRFAYNILTIISLIIRIAVSVLVISIAFRQNRNSTIWGLFAFFFPSIALIVIGMLKKLKLKIELDSKFSSNQQVAKLLEKANQFYYYKRYSECIQILNKAIEIEDKNFDCIKLRGLAQYQLNNYIEAKTEFETLINNGKFLEDAFYYMGLLAFINRERKLAVTFWNKANELNNKSAKTKLALYHTYTSSYILSKFQKTEKLTKKLLFKIESGSYIGGLAEIDAIENPAKLKTKMYVYDNGLEVALRKTLKSYHICIAYYEIDKIIYAETEKLFKLCLADRKVLTFSYDQNRDCQMGLNKFIIRFKQVTERMYDSTASSIE